MSAIPPEIELLNWDVIVNAIEDFTTAAQCFGTGDCHTAKFGPGLGAIEGLSEIVLQL